MTSTEVIMSHPRLNFKSLPPGFFENSQPFEKALEMMWLHAVAHLPNTKDEIWVPDNAVVAHGPRLLQSLALRLG